MNKYGWEWKSEEAAEAYAQILAYVRNGGGFDGPKGIVRLLSLADKLVHCEGRIPDSFLVSVDLGIIYSSACLFEGEDSSLCEEFLAKAAEAWCIASSYLENGQPKATAGLDSNAAHVSYMRHYRLIPCEIGFARYLRSDRKELSYLADIKAQWEEAAKEDPGHKVLKVIGKHIREDLTGEHIKPELANEERTSGSPVQNISSASSQVVTTRAPAIATRSHTNPALQIPVESAPAPVTPSIRSVDSIESPRAQKRTPRRVHPSGKIGSASAQSGAAHDGSREAPPTPSSARSRVESVTEVVPTTLEAAPAPVAPSIRSSDFIESRRALEITPRHVHPSGHMGSASADSAAAHDGSREAPPAPSSARSRVESATEVVPTTPDTPPAPVAPGQKLLPAWRPFRISITSIVVSMILIWSVGYFATGGFWKMSTPQNSPPQPHTAAPPTVASPAITASPLGGNNPLAEVDADATSHPPALPPAISKPSISQQPMAKPTKSGKAVYASSCRSCHSTGVSGSPRLDDVEGWRPRLARSRASLYASVLEGKGAMPPRGGDRLLRDEEIRRAVDFMVAEARTAAKDTKTTRAAVPIAPSAPTASTQPALAAFVTPVPATPVGSQADWLAAMRGELDRCRQSNFFGRVVCTEKVRWKYCAPNRWQTLPECAV